MGGWKFYASKYIVVRLETTMGTMVGTATRSNHHCPFCQSPPPKYDSDKINPFIWKVIYIMQVSVSSTILNFMLQWLSTRSSLLQISLILEAVYILVKYDLSVYNSLLSLADEVYCTVTSQVDIHVNSWDT